MDQHESVAVLECGCGFEFTDHPDLVPIKVGGHFSCWRHSDIYGYDPDTGEPRYDRDQRIIRIETLPS